MNPDYLIEKYWLDLKQSMDNFYTVSNIPPRPIKMWSAELNTLQSLKQYMEIEYNINNYISLFAIDVIRHQSCYYIDILATNIKRWYHTSSQIIMTDKYNNIIFLLFDIYHSLLKNNHNSDDITTIHSMFQMVELYIIYEDFSVLIKYAIEYNKPGVLDKLKTKYDINTMIFKIYRIDVTQHTINNNSKISGKKIIQIINNMN